MRGTTYSVKGSAYVVYKDNSVIIVEVGGS